MPLILGAIIPPVVQLYEPNGPPIPDPTAQAGEVIVQERGSGSAVPNSAPNSALVRYEVEVPDGRIFVLSAPSDLSTPFMGRVTKSLHDEERRRGRLFEPADMPLRTGEVSITYDKSNKMPFSWGGHYWSDHLKRGFDPGAWLISAGLIGCGLALYMIARAIGWILNGFFGKKDSVA